MTGPNVLGAIGAIVILILLFELLRRHRLREKYALIWVVVALGMLVAAAFPGVVVWASQTLGLQVPANLLFFVASLVLLVLTLHLSYELGRVEEKTRTLAEEIALLRLELANLTNAAPTQAERSDVASPGRDAGSTHE